MAEHVKELSYSAVCASGICRDPFSEDLKFNECVSDKGFNKLEM